VEAEKASSGVTRRVLLTAGGLTVLGIYSVAREDPSPAAASAAQSRTGRLTLAHAESSLGDPRATGSRARRRPAATVPPASGPAGHRSARTRSARARLDAARRGSGAGGPAGYEQPMRYIDDGLKAIALTIDDGPSPVYTPQVLRLLEKYRITATFSMIGIQASAYPGVAREVAAAGHLIANHTWTHLDLAYFAPAVVADQMDRATGAIHAATGRVPDLFRAPYGAWSPYVLRRCAQTRMVPLGWSVDPRDWSRPGVSSIIANIMRNTRTGSIILEHDGGGNRSQTVAALTYVIPRLLAAGYHFRTP
jgi:peptidoglycan-N-acetylglucosamine deacetylase